MNCLYRLNHRNYRCFIIGRQLITKFTKQYSSIKQEIIPESTEKTKQKKTDVNTFTTRSYNCNQLREEHINETVTLCGWLEFHRVGKFLILRDGYGRTQLLIPETNKHLQQIVDKLPYESVLQVTGVVAPRPPGTEQPSMNSGRIEVIVQELKVLNPALKTLPFNVRDYNKAKESLRMQYRYLDLRYSEMQRNLRQRSTFLMNLREFLVNEAAFVDVETPTLFRKTPGGAQEFIVPTRFPQQFYSLVQSPQQFKQMLMVGAIDRYFQIARCYRDEGARSDRQPEFTQLDIEMSFTSVDGVIDLVERMLKYCLPQLDIPFERISYQEAMRVYGSDKPDVSFGNHLIDCTEIVKPELGCEDCRALVFRKPLTDLTNSMKRRYGQFVGPNVKLIQQKLDLASINDWTKNISKLLGQQIPHQLIEHLQIKDDCVLFVAFGSRHDVCSVLGKIRTDFAGHTIKKNKEMKFMWVVDFPLFEKNANANNLASVHHPFTAPHPDDLKLLDSQPLKVRSQAYDLVLNGNEIAGGSIRIHNVEEQKHILNMLHIPHEEMTHMLEALASGCPPHGGIALGLDRLLSIILGTNSIRDVIAFPKGIEGRCPLSGAPVTLSPEDKKLYHLK